MIENRHCAASKLAWLFTVAFVASFLLFETYLWGKYISFACAALVVCFSIIDHKGKIKICFGWYHVFLAALTLYTAYSSLWAIQPSESRTKALTFLLTLALMSLLYFHYIQKDDISELLKVVKWTGFFVSIYAIFFYGFDTLMIATEESRLDNEFSNVNSIGMIASLSCVIGIHEIMTKKFNSSALLMIPSFIVIAATQSRKAFVMLIVGVLALFVMKAFEDKKLEKVIWRLAALAIVIIIVVTIISQISMLHGVLERMEKLIASFTGEGEVDKSTIMRNNMVKLGLDWFKKYPIGGVGIGCPHILSAQYLLFDAYLHNNYVELLCGGGIVGFLLYYGTFIYLFYQLIKFRQFFPNYFRFCFVWLILMLIIDLGAVSYIDKVQWFYLMIQFVNIECMKRKFKQHPKGVL